MGDLSISLKNGLTIKQDRSCCGIPVTRIETLSNGVFNRDKLGYANIYDKEQYCNYILDDKDLLISHINSKQYVGRTVLYRKMENEYIIHGMNLLRLKLNRELTFPEFIVYYFKSSYIKEQIRKYRKDAVNQSSISINDIKKIRLLLPPLQTQGQIVEELNCLTSIIEKQKKQLEELDNLAQSIFYDMFGDPIENEKGWEFKKIEDLCSVVGGSTPKTNIPEYWDGDNYWVTPAELNEKYISSTIRSITDKGVKSANLKMLPKGTVLFTSRAPIGKVSITRAPMFCNQGFKNFICSDIIINEYLYHVLLYNTEYLNSLGVGATFKEVSKSKISSVRISLPPLSLQQQFASKIEAIEKQKELIKKSIKETEDLFNSRMDYYFN